MFFKLIWSYKILLYITTFSCVICEDDYEPMITNYHEAIGIKEATEIKNNEDDNFNGTKVTGGTAIDIRKYPYQAGLLITLTSGYISVCGASLISNTRLVTAGHCSRDTGSQAREFLVVLGSNRLYSGGLRLVTSLVEVHQNYNPYTLANDVAIIGIPRVTFTDTIQKVSLPTGNLLWESYEGWPAVATGYGKISDSSYITPSQHLSHVELQIVSNSICERTYGRSNVRPSTLCTIGPGGANTCNGDSGGPIVIYSGGVKVLVGIVSFGALRGCQSGLPSGHSRVTAFSAWITARM